MRLVGHVLEDAIVWKTIVSLATLASASAGVEAVGRSTFLWWKKGLVAFV